MFGSTTKKCLLCVLCIFGLNSILLSAQTAVEKLIASLPQDTLFFAATSGRDQLAPAFEKTSIHQIITDPSAQNFANQIKTVIQTQMQIAGNSDHLIEAFSIIDLITSQPCLIGVSQVDQAKVSGHIPFYGYLIVDCSPTKKEAIAELMQTFEQFLRSEEEVISTITIDNDQFTTFNSEEAPIYWGWIQGKLIITINDIAKVFIPAVKKSSDASGLLKKTNMLDANGDVFVVALEIDKIKQLIFTLAREHNADPEIINKIDQVLKKSDIDKFQTIVSRIGIKGKNFVLDESVDLSSPLNGLMSIMKPIKKDQLLNAQKDVNTTLAINIDLVSMYDHILDLVGVFTDPDKFEWMKGNIGYFEEDAGFKIRDEFLASFAGPCTSYNVELATGTGIGKEAIIVPLKNATAFKKSYAKIIELAQENLDQGIIQTNIMNKDGLEIHTCMITPLAMLNTMPCWTVVDSQLVLALDLETLDQAVKHIQSKDKLANSILSNTELKACVKNLPDNLLLFNFEKTSAVVSASNDLLKQFWPMATMALMQENIFLPSTVPSIKPIAQTMDSTIDYTWLDGSRICHHSEGPFIMSSTVAIGGTALGVSILMPALARARELAKRVQSASQISGLIKCCHIYANENNDQLPDSFDQIKSIIGEDSFEKMTVNPRAPRNAPAPHYILVNWGSLDNIDDPSTTVLIFENPDYCSEIVNVGFADSSVKQIPIEQLDNLLKSLPSQNSSRNQSF